MLLRRLPGLLQARPKRMTEACGGRRLHVYAGNPLKNRGGAAAAESLATVLLGNDGGDHKVLPLQKGRPLTRSDVAASLPTWRLSWLPPARLGLLPAESFVYLGSDAGAAHYWAVDAGELDGGDGSSFVDLRTLMHAADWSDEQAMEELAIAGHAKALLEWHGASRFCGHCGGAMVHIEAGRRKECTNPSCRKRSYPRVDPVVIMLVVDKENDRVLLSRQSRYAPRMWSCLAGFAEPGESLEEAVRRETWEETGIQVGEVVYHSSQPWPDARWHSREDVRRALAYEEYDATRRATAEKVNQMCNGGEDKSQRTQSSYPAMSGELGPMYVPGPYAIAHHLISSWVNENGSDGVDSLSRKSTSFSSL
ncbi:nudix hydrolase homolog 19 isoform X2 [Wolffia australiana]